MSDENSLKLKILGPAAESVGSTLQSVWDIVFGGITLYGQKKKFMREQDLISFKKSVEDRVVEIPEDCLKEPQLSILGPTLEASKFYFEEKPLREMFSALAAASMDARKEKDLHPSYPEIIKQMSPLDAKNLSFFNATLPIAEYYQEKQDSTHKRRTILSNVFLANKNELDLEVQSRSIASLCRLGLIEVDYERYMLSTRYYSAFYTTDYFLDLQEKLKPRWSVGVSPGRVRTTPLGKSFRSVCLE